MISSFSVVSKLSPHDSTTKRLALWYVECQIFSAPGHPIVSAPPVTDAEGHNDPVIASSLAGRLRDAGLEWHPAPGDFFRIDGPEFASDDIFTVSDMTVEPHEFDTGTILGFNGTTEWALDSVSLEQALWLPREDQLRERLGDAFVSLSVRAKGDWRVATRGATEERHFDAGDPESAYALALLAQIDVAALR